MIAVLQFSAGLLVEWIDISVICLEFIGVWLLFIATLSAYGLCTRGRLSHTRIIYCSRTIFKKLNITLILYIKDYLRIWIVDKEAIDFVVEDRTGYH